MCTITKNEQFNSYELHFDSKPPEAVRDILKANGYRWHSVKRVWYGYKDIAEQIGAITELPATSRTESKAEQQTDKAQQNELIEKYVAAYCNGRKWAKPDEERKEIARVIELNDGELLAIEKPRIKTRFCFGYGYNGVSTQEEYNDAHDAKHIADTQESYFIRKNLEQLTEVIDSIKDYLQMISPGYSGTVYAAPYLFCYGERLRELYFRYDYQIDNRRDNYRQPTVNELQRIITAYEIEIKEFEKRLQTYLKRYGLTKLHTWTYLSD